MSMNVNINDYMLSFLTKSKVYANPFHNLYSNNNQQFQSRESYHESFDDEREIRCPICLGRVIGAVRPNTCFQIYCSFCIKKWKNEKSQCPLCKKQFKSLIKVYLNEKWIQNNQGELFAY